MTKERIKGLISGFLVGTLIAGGTVFATLGAQKIDVVYDNIEIVVDGKKIEPKDANGNTVEPFIYNGTTYLPVRAIGNAVGKEVAWDGVEKVVYLGTKPGNEQNWFDVCAPYQYHQGEAYHYADNEYFTMSGNKYTNGFVFDHRGKALVDKHYSGTAMFNLNGKFNSVSFTVGHVDGSKLSTATMDIYIDGIIAYTKELSSDNVAQKVTIPLNGALQMKIDVHGPTYGAQWGFSEGKFE